MLATGRYHVTDRAHAPYGFDIAVVTVPTPLREGLPDLSAVLDAAKTIRPFIGKGALVILESTVAPGTTAGVFRDTLARGFALLGQFHVAYSPERIDPGNPTWRFANTPKLVAGTTPAARDAAVGFYESICEEVVPVASVDVAELAKLLENTYRHVNIALVNELARHAHELGIDIWQVIAAAATKPYGFQPFRPGPGVGGHCLPIDPVYLSHRVQTDLGKPFDFVNLAMRVNDDQPAYIVDRAAELLNADRKALNGSGVLVLGMAYKAGTGDCRETPAARIVDLLVQRGAEVTVCDPHVNELLGALPAGVKVETLDQMSWAARVADLVILVTDHEEFPYDTIAGLAPRILDTRNRFPRAANVQTL
ncbi:MAG: nucleotide sugar dehydrogenase, partial [Catenulispora sp.]